MIGEQLGAWVLERELGRGGMGTVYLARRAAPGDGPDRAAVKVLAPQLSMDPGSHTRFQREIEVLRKLEHPNIVRLLEAGEHRGLHFYAMEYVDGQSFQSLLREQGRIPWPEVLDMALQVCLALKHAHDHGIIHRDLKPSNLLRGKAATNEAAGDFGAVKLTDFGIAWVFSAEHLTATGAVIGTAEYLSPEQAAGKKPTRKSDLYSLGAVLYTLLTGRPPFEGEPVDLLHKHRYGQFDKPTRLVPDLPPDFEEAICELLEKDPDRRPPDAAVLHKRLDSLRRKYERKAGQHTTAGDDTAVEGKPRRQSQAGPATIVASFVREELRQEREGGPIKQFFNRPTVVLPLFVLTLGLIVWIFLPSSAESLFGRAANLMESDDPDDWYKAEEYVEKLEKDHPDYRPDEVAAFRRRVDREAEARSEASTARRASSMSEAHWFYERGLRLRQEGKEEEARTVWKNLIVAFKDVRSESIWVQWAEHELTDPKFPERKGSERWASIRDALERAHQLEADGKKAEAEQIRKALRELYATDPSARDILDGKAP